MRGLQRRVRQLAAVFVAALLVTAAVPEQGDNAASRSDSAEDESPFGLNLLSMMEGMGVMKGGKQSPVIDVGLDWKYVSATATEKITTPKLIVGTDETPLSRMHVEVADAKKAGMFTGSDDVEVEIVSRSKSPVLGMTSGNGRWDVRVPDGDSFHIGKFGMKPTIKLTDGKIGIAVDGTPKATLHVQSNSKGDHLMFQGNFDGKVDALADSLVVLESSEDNRARGAFMPHRGRGNTGSSAWFAGVPNGGGGYQIGSSASQLVESTSGPYVKKQAHVFVSNGGKVAVGHTDPEGQLDVQLTAGNKDDADRAVNIRGGSINVEMGQGLNTARIGAILGEKNFLQVGSAQKAEEREIRLQAGEEQYVTISRYNAYVGIGGVKTPSVPLEVKGAVKVSEGQFTHTMDPKPQEQMMVLNSQSTVPAAIGFRQADKPYMSISAGKGGGTVELANGAALTIANGNFGVGTDPSELFHVKGGDVLLEGDTNLWLKSKVSGTRIYAKDGVHVTGGLAGKVHVEDSELVVTNKGSDGVVNIRAGPNKESMVRFAAGDDTWKVQTSSGSLMFDSKQAQFTMTKEGQLGVGVAIPTESLHVKGSILMESPDAAAFATMKAGAETVPAGIKLMSGAEEWRVLTSGAGSTDVAPGSLEFAHGLKTHVVISKAGALGVGTGTPLAGTSLHVKGPSMYTVGAGKGKLVISTPNGNPGLSFFDNDGYRRMDLETHSKGISLMNMKGFFGIGIREPASKLHLYDSKSTTLTLSRSGKQTSEAYLKYAGPYLKIGTASTDGVQVDVNGEPRMTVHPNGNVGFGTTVPKSQIQVGETSHLYQAGSFTVVAANAFFDGAKFKYTTAAGAGAMQMSKDGTLGLYTAEQGSASMEVTGFEKARLTVTAKGLIGVGTATPESSFHVAPTEAATLQSNGAFMVGAGKSKPNIAMDERTIVARDNGQPSTLRLNPFGGGVSFFADSTKPGHVATFGSDGKIGFGPAKPEAKLHVSEGPGRYSTIAIGEGNAGIGVIRYKQSMMTLGFSKTAASATNKEDAITILKEGNVGVGTSAPKAKLHVEGDVEISGKLNIGGKQIVTMMEELKKENQRLSLELSSTKEMLMSMSSNMKRMSEMQMQQATEN